MTVPCSSCSGTGHRELTVVERDTIAAVGKTWSPTFAISKRLKRIQGYETSIPALANRLVALLDLKLVERRARDGKSFEWRAP